MKHWFSRFDVFPTRRRLASFTIMVGRKAMASLMKHGFSTAAGTLQRKVAILGAAGGIGQPLGLLPKLNPLVSQLALYDIAGRMGVSADISNANKRAEGISTFHPNFQVASDGSEQPVRSPLMQAPTPTAGNTLLQAKAKVVRAVLKKINQSPKKVGLVAKLVRGMRADDALMQLTVLPKRAAKTVYKVVHSARANAIHNNGLDSARLIVAEAFVGKGVYSKRLWIHGRGKHGVRTRRTCRLTVVLKEMSPAEEAELAKTRVIRFQEQRAHKAKASKLFPHRLIETRWNPQRNLIRKRSPLSPLRTVKGFT